MIFFVIFGELRFSEGVRIVSAGHVIEFHLIDRVDVSKHALHVGNALCVRVLLIAVFVRCWVGVSKAVGSRDEAALE